MIQQCDRLAAKDLSVRHCGGWIRCVILLSYCEVAVDPAIKLAPGIFLTDSAIFYVKITNFSQRTIKHCAVLESRQGNEDF